MPHHWLQHKPTRWIIQRNRKRPLAVIEIDNAGASQTHDHLPQFFMRMTAAHPAGLQSTQRVNTPDREGRIAAAFYRDQNSPLVTPGCKFYPLWAH
jgi:hypothetical protein